MQPPDTQIRYSIHGIYLGDSYEDVLMKKGPEGSVLFSRDGDYANSSIAYVQEKDYHLVIDLDENKHCREIRGNILKAGESTIKPGASLSKVKKILGTPDRSEQSYLSYLVEPTQRLDIHLRENRVSVVLLKREEEQKKTDAGGQGTPPLTNSG